LSPPRENPTSNLDPQPDARLPHQAEDQRTSPYGTPPRLNQAESGKPPAFPPTREDAGEAASRPEPDGKGWFNDRQKSKRRGGQDPASGETATRKGRRETSGQELEPDPESGEPAVAAALPAPEDPPTPEAVERYRVRLEERLAERYNNLPDFAGQVGVVMAILAKPVEVSLDGKLLRAEFDQLVYDKWGGRLPQLEKEYYVVTFGSGGAETVRSDPGIRIGLDLEKSYSERAPLAADPFRRAGGEGSLGKEGAAKMPDWWRPEFPELK
jgi:hypothetical protein